MLNFAGKEALETISHTHKIIIVTWNLFLIRTSFPENTNSAF